MNFQKIKQYTNRTLYTLFIITIGYLLFVSNILFFKHDNTSFTIGISQDEYSYVDDMTTEEIIEDARNRGIID